MKDKFTKEWITRNSIAICAKYELGVLTLRALHYQLVGLGMTNDIQHYKRVVKSMIDARWLNIIAFEQFSDLDREMVGYTDYTETILEDQIDTGKQQIGAWMSNYSKNRWENQPVYPEVFIEKKALQGVFERVCRRNDVGLGACKGYPSLSFLNETAKRFQRAIRAGKQPVIIYFGDYDPSGEDIPRSIKENLSKLGADVDVQRIALMEHQVIKWKLPPAPAKETDSRTKKWNGLGQVELDAVKPEKLQTMCQRAIDNLFNTDLHAELLEKESEERQQYRIELRNYVNSIGE